MTGRGAKTRLGLVALAGALLGTLPGEAGAISRREVVTRAMSYCAYPWTCTTAHLTASCEASYRSLYGPGDYVGLPYDWGGYKTLHQFEQDLAAGRGAGTWPNPAFGVLSCTTGLDCSGFVSKCWDTGHYGTSTLTGVSAAIAADQTRPGDVFNIAGYHVVLLGRRLASGWPVFYEALGMNTHVNAEGGWLYVDGYVPRRFDGIEETPTGTVPGSLAEPIVVGALPFVYEGDTAESPSDMLDAYGCDPNKSEAGPEVVFAVDVDRPGTLTIALQGDQYGVVDNDLHLLTAPTERDCLARHDNLISRAVTGCGRYWVVVDTFRSNTHGETPGPFTLSIELTPSGAACGADPYPYEPEGQPGDPCAFAGNPNLPFCNENLGATVCLITGYTAQDVSFCSKPCARDGDCADLTAGGGACCGWVPDDGGGENLCLLPEFCEPAPPDPGPSPDTGGPRPDTGTPRPDAGSWPDVVAPRDVGAPPDTATPPDTGVRPDAGQRPETADTGGAPADTPRPPDAGGPGRDAAAGPDTARADLAPPAPDAAADPGGPPLPADAYVPRRDGGPESGGEASPDADHDPFRTGRSGGGCATGAAGAAAAAAPGPATWLALLLLALLPTALRRWGWRAPTAPDRR
jgi:hypothetical protein